MLQSINKNWFFLLSIVTIILVFSLSYIFPELWENENFREKFFKVGFYLCGIISALWMLQYRSLLFRKGDYFRSLIICIGATTVFLWTYKHKITFRMDLLLLFLCGLYSIVYHKWTRLDRVMITFFLVITLRYLGILWSVDIPLAWQDVEEDTIYFLLLAPIVCFGFRIKERESMSFITLCFKLFLLLLTLNISIYIFVYKSIGIPFFSFFTFNKSYINFTEHILAWTFFKHQSFISWVIFTIWGLGFLVWRKDRRYISLSEVVLYSILLFCFAFIVQARVVIIGIPLGILLLGWLQLSEKWTVRKRIGYEIGIFLIGVLGVYLLINYTTYFADPIRKKMLSKVFTSINTHPIIGNGAAYERFIAQETVELTHVHNDFLAILVDLGIIGFMLPLLCVFSIYRKAVLYRDSSIMYCLMSFLLLMNTDVMLNNQPGVFITVPFLIFVFFKKRIKIT